MTNDIEEARRERKGDVPRPSSEGTEPVAPSDVESRPRTEAGKQLFDHIAIVAWFDQETDYLGMILAIEAEA